MGRSRPSQAAHSAPSPIGCGKGEPQASHHGASRKRTRAHASAERPLAWGAGPPSSACGGKAKSTSPRPSARSAGFQRAVSAPSAELMSAPPVLFDRALHRRRLDRAAPAFGAADFLKRRAAEDAVFRLEAILRDFPVAVDLGARSGALREALRGSAAEGRIGLLLETDFSERMLRGRAGVVADEERLPFAPASVDLIVSLLALHWTNDLPGALIQIRRALKPDGLFVGALFGGETLTELRHSLLQAEAELTGGAGLRVSPFAEGADGAALLQRAGFAIPVTDVDRVTVRYRHPLELLRDLRRMGETNVLVNRDRRPLSRAVLGRAFEVYGERYGLEDGRVPATFEIVTVTGWAPHESQQKPLPRGSAKMRLAEALGTVEQSTGVKPGEG